MRIFHSRGLVVAVALLALGTQAEARRCINGTVMSSTGQCVPPGQAQPTPTQAAPSAAPASGNNTARSCPMDFAWNGQRCAPVPRCPYDSKTCRR